MILVKMVWLYQFVYKTEMCSTGNKTVLVEYMKRMYRIVGRIKEEYLWNIDQTNHQEIQFMRELKEYNFMGKSISCFLIFKTVVEYKGVSSPWCPVSKHKFKNDLGGKNMSLSLGSI